MRAQQVPAGLRGGDLSIPPRTAITVESTRETIAMGQLYAYRGIVPSVDAGVGRLQARRRVEVPG